MPPLIRAFGATGSAMAFLAATIEAGDVIAAVAVVSAPVAGIVTARLTVRAQRHRTVVESESVMVETAHDLVLMLRTELREALADLAAAKSEMVELDRQIVELRRQLNRARTDPGQSGPP